MAPAQTQDVNDLAIQDALGQASQSQATPAASQPDVNDLAIQDALGNAPPAQGQTQQPGMAASVWGGVKQAGSDIWDTVKSTAAAIEPPALRGDFSQGSASVLPPAYTNMVASAQQGIKELPADYHAYEQARQSGASPLEAASQATGVKAAKDQIVAKVKQGLAEFDKNPTQTTTRALLDATALAASIWGPGEIAALKGSEVAGAGAAEEAAGAATEAEATTAETAAKSIASDTGTANATEQAALTPKAQAVAAGTAKAAKAGISEGTAETVAPRVEDIQPQIHQGIRDFINQTAKTAGLDPIPDSAPITDVPQKLADAFQERSQDTFDKVEEITGLNPTTLKQQMAARTDQITEAAASGDLEKAGKLEMLQKADENRAIQAFNQAKAQNVDVEQARSDWNASLRADELSAAVRGSKANTSTLRNPVLDPNKLAPRLQKLAEGQPGGKTPKLFQLGGEDNATRLVEHAENGREAVQAIKDFTPKSATGQKLWAQIQAKNTAEKSSLLRGGKVVAKTDWNGVVRDIGNLTPDQQAALGDDFSRMRQLAGKQAARQNATDWITGTTTAGKMVRGALAEELLRRSF